MHQNLGISYLEAGSAATASELIYRSGASRGVRRTTTGVPKAGSARPQIHDCLEPVGRYWFGTHDTELWTRPREPVERHRCIAIHEVTIDGRSDVRMKRETFFAVAGRTSSSVLERRFGFGIPVLDWTDGECHHAIRRARCRKRVKTLLRRPCRGVRQNRLSKK